MRSGAYSREFFIQLSSFLKDFESTEKLKKQLAWLEMNLKKNNDARKLKKELHLIKLMRAKI